MKGRPTIEDLRVRGTFGSPAVDGWVSVDRLDLAHALGLVTDCEECKGKGVLGGCAKHECDHAHTFMFCPACGGRGWVVSPEAAERAMKAIYQGTYQWHRDRQALLDHTEDALRAALGIEDE
jgi:hypothetical protein